MIGKILEAFFRHKLLLLLPPILIPAVIGPLALFTAPSYFESFAGAWVDQPAYINAPNDFSPWVLPSQTQSGKLSELMRTDGFLMDVARRTSLAPLVNSPAGQTRIRDIFDRGLILATNGSHSVILRFRASTPQLAYQGAQAVLDAFQERLASNQVDQAQIGINFYSSQINDAQAQAAKNSAALRAYLDSTQGAGSTYGTDPTTGQAASSLDPRLSDLRTQATLSQAQLEKARSSLDAARLASAAALEGAALGFQVIDPPQMPLAPVRDLKKSLIYPIAGLVAGLGLSIAVLVLLVASDRTARTDADLLSMGRVLGIVPQLKVKRVPRTLRPAATRRAIGFVAGSALPSPAGAQK